MWTMLEKFGSALLKPLHLLAQSQIGRMAETLAVRQGILQNQVDLRLELYVERGAVDPDRAVGIGRRCIEELSGTYGLIIPGPAKAGRP
jgi:hypothetical protein